VDANAGEEEGEEEDEPVLSDEEGER